MGGRKSGRSAKEFIVKNAGRNLLEKGVEIKLHINGGEKVGEVVVVNSLGWVADARERLWERVMNTNSLRQG